MGPPIRVILGSLVSAGYLVTAMQASAQAGDRAAAEALFQKGRDAMASEDYGEACSAFEESNRLDPAPGTMVNLADCEQSRGHPAVAWQWLERALGNLPANDSRRELLAGRIADLKAHLPLLTLRLAPGAPPDTRVERDGVELRSASLGLALPVDPGDHHVVASAAGRAEKRYVVALVEKEQRELVVEPGAPLMAAANSGTPAPPAAATGASTGADTRPAAPPSGRDTRTLGYVIGGVGVAGIGTAFVFGGLVLGKKGTVQEHCDFKNRTCDQTGLEAASSGTTFSTVSTVSFIVGVAATGAGAYFILTSRHRPEASVGAAALRDGGLVRVAAEF